MSVLITVRDNARFLAEAVDSVLAQTLTDLELVVVDDGSTDESPGILDGYAARDPRVRVFHRPPSGIAAASNFGLAQCRAELIARLDADDIAMPDRLERQVAWMETHPDLVALGGWMITIDASGRELDVRRYPTDPEAFRVAMLASVAMAHPASILRRRAVLEVGGYRSEFNYASDYDLWLRLEERGGLANLPEVVTRYRLHADQVTTRSRPEQARSAELALRLAKLRRSGGTDPLTQGLGLEAALRAVGLEDVGRSATSDSPAPAANIQIPVGKHRIAVAVPETLLAAIDAFFPFAARAAGGVAEITVEPDGDQRFTVAITGQSPQRRLTRGEAIELIRRGVTMKVAATEAITLRAGAAAWNARAVLIVAPPGAGKSSLLAWLIEKGFAYVSDDLTTIDAADGAVAGLAGPLAFQRLRLQTIVDLPAFSSSDSLRSRDIVLVAADRAWLAPPDGLECGLAIFPRFLPGAQPRISSLASSDVAGRLAEAMYTPAGATDPRRAALTAFAEHTPAFAIEYGSFADIDGLLAQAGDIHHRGRPAARRGRAFPQGISGRPGGAAARAALSDSGADRAAPEPKTDDRHVDVRRLRRSLFHHPGAPHVPPRGRWTRSSCWWSTTTPTARRPRC